MEAGEYDLSQYVITKQLTKAPHEYPDAKSQAHVQVALRRRNECKQDGVAQVCLLMPLSKCSLLGLLDV